MISILASYFIFTANASEYVWKSPPHIIMCDDTGVLEDAVKKSLLFWEESGKKHSSFSHSKSCKDDDSIPSNSIYIYNDDGRLRFLELGRSTMTFIRSDGVKVVQYSEIFISIESFENGKVICHELGHAFGMPHSESRESIMHPNPTSSYESCGMMF